MKETTFRTIVGISIVLLVIVGLMSGVQSYVQPGEPYQEMSLSGSGANFEGANTDQLIVDQTSTGDIVEFRNSGTVRWRLAYDGTITSSGAQNFTGDVTVAGDVGVTGNLAVTGDITDTGYVLIDGSADEIQLTVQAYTTPTTQVFVVENSGGTDKFTVDSSGNTVVVGTLGVSGATTVADVTSSGTITATTFIGALTGNVTGNLTGDVTSSGTSSFADVDASGTITATTFIGALTGNVTGDVTSSGTSSFADVDASGTITATTFIGALTGNVTGDVTSSGTSSFADVDASGTITATTFIGALTGNVTGDVTSSGTSSFADVDASGTITATTGFIGGLVDVGSWLSLSAGTVAIADGESITATATYMQVTSADTVTMTNTSIPIVAGTRVGDMLIIENANAVFVINVDGTGGTVECKADLALGSHDTATLLWNGSAWICISLYDNS